MKGLYIIWPDTEYIDKAIAAGIDTLLINLSDIPKDPPSVYYDSYETTIALLERYKDNKRLKKYIMPYWVRQWVDIPAEQQMVHNGVKITRTPCTTNRAYIESRVNPVVGLYKQGLCDGILWDVEEYGSAVPEQCLKIFGQEVKCECEYCKDLSFKEQWNIHRNIVKGLLQEIPVNGHIPYLKNWWGLDRYPGEPIVLLGDSYYGYTWKDRLSWWWIKQKLKLLHGIKCNVMPGIFLEVLPYDKFFDLLQYTLKHYDSYWIYTQKIMSRNSRITEDEIKTLGYVNFDLVTDDFFARLKEINK